MFNQNTESLSNKLFLVANFQDLGESHFTIFKKSSDNLENARGLCDLRGDDELDEGCLKMRFRIH